MKIAIGSEGKELSDNISELFARSLYFIIAEIQNGKISGTETLLNENADKASGAGIFAAQLMADKNIDAVIAKSVGPRAMDVLKQFNIEVYHGEGVIGEAIKKFIDEKAVK